LKPISLLVALFLLLGCQEQQANTAPTATPTPTPTPSPSPSQKPIVVNDEKIHIDFKAIEGVLNNFNKQMVTLANKTANDLKNPQKSGISISNESFNLDIKKTKAYLKQLESQINATANLLNKLFN